MIHDVVLHMGFEAVGAGVAFYAYNFCEHLWHRVAVWLILAAILSVVTVLAVG